jgi:hypothetical protein
MFCFRG